MRRDLPKPWNSVLNPASDVGPVEPTEATPERGDSNRMNLSFPDYVDEGAQSGLDILHPALLFPMALRGEVDNVLRMVDVPGFEDEHAPGLYLVTQASRRRP